MTPAPQARAQAERDGTTLLQARRKLHARKLLVERNHHREFGSRHKFDWSRHDDVSARDIEDALATGLLNTADVLDAVKAIDGERVAAKMGRA